MPSTQNIFVSLPLAPQEAIFQLTAAYKADQFQEKVDVGVGAYRIDCGKRWVLPVVKTVIPLYLGPTISGTGANHLGGLFLAYQGFASGHLDNDVWADSHLVICKIPLLICQCFAKKAGPYGERIGWLTVVSKDQDDASRIESQISVLQCSEISNPPANGAWAVESPFFALFFTLL
ncbi:Aspartate aminotransferase, cytoplasmic [Puccinia graminis f. sp. tritici]|uniref:Aspartate aminotransferase, cytoplasmic n=1 Tax=Puccinia graminis f. sp. tritici TaxID=56615 RepID=A0A5B0PXW7_PUCGR|nr:Aspartate aminotransferase, cytoplasmic [Puccinia graminis f. sp. tritici]